MKGLKQILFTHRLIEIVVRQDRFLINCRQYMSELENYKEVMVSANNNPQQFIVSVTSLYDVLTHIAVNWYYINKIKMNLTEKYRFCELLQSSLLKIFKAYLFSERLQNFLIEMLTVYFSRKSHSTPQNIGKSYFVYQISGISSNWYCTFGYSQNFI